MTPQISSPGHYFDAGNGSCSAAVVTDTFAALADGIPSAVNVAGWNHGGTAFTRSSVPIDLAPNLEASANSFHLKEECPWKR
jgi:hypothetical protein